MSNRFQLISKGDSLIIKGVAVLLMLWHHLFGDPTRWPENSKIVWTFPGSGSKVPIQWPPGIRARG